MHGRRIYHARGKILGGSSSHQRDDLPARQPAGLRALGGRPGHGDVGLRPLPAVLPAHGGLRWPRRRTIHGAGTAGRFRWSAARPRTPCSAPSSRPPRRPGYPLDGRRQRLSPGGLRPVRPEHPARAPDLRGPGLPAPRHEPAEPRRSGPRAFVTRVLFEGSRAVGVEYRTGSGGMRRVQAGEVILAGGSINSPQLLQLSGVGNARGARRPRGPRRRATCRGSARTSRTTSRSTSSTARRSPSRCSRRSRSGAGRGSASSGCSCAAGRAPRTTSRAAASSGATTTSPTRTCCSTSCRWRSAMTGRRRAAGTATRSTSGRCTPTPAAR